jgi:thiol-disulfide isomerase/thioredoxin
MFNSKFAAVFISAFLTLSSIHGQGYEIGITVSNLRDTSLIIGHYLNRSMYPDDTLRLNSKGQGVFKGDNKLDQGLYIIYLPNTSYFEIIMGNDQEFSIKSDTADFINTLAFEGSEENTIFLDFQRAMITLRNKADSLTNALRAQTSTSERNKLNGELQSINTERINLIGSIVKQHPDLFVSAFLKATLEIEVPEPPRDEKGNITDSLWQYYYYRNHYFDNFDLSDSRLLRTPLYEDKMINYLTKIISQVPDSIIPETDMIIDKSLSDSTLFRYVLVTLFNHYGKSNIMGMDAVQMHIAEKYYLTRSWWSDSTFISDLKTRIERTTPLLIGKTAPDIDLMSVPGDHFIKAASDTALKKNPHVGTSITLYEIDAEYTVLLFWEADCGHCQTALPEMYNLYEESLKDLSVTIVAISTLFGEEGKIMWADFVNEHGIYNWINAWNPYSYEYKLKYDIVSTPTIYILDRDKKIIAKKVSPVQVAEIITSLIN